MNPAPIICRMPSGWYALLPEHRLLMAYAFEMAGRANGILCLPGIHEARRYAADLSMRGLLHCDYAEQEDGPHLFYASLTPAGEALCAGVEAAEAQALSDWLWRFVKTGSEASTAQILYTTQN